MYRPKTFHRKIPVGKEKVYYVGDKVSHKLNNKIIYLDKYLSYSNIFLPIEVFNDEYDYYYTWWNLYLTGIIFENETFPSYLRKAIFIRIDKTIFLTKYNGLVFKDNFNFNGVIRLGISPRDRYLNYCCYEARNKALVVSGHVSGEIKN